jgi:hypothetical protein
MSVTVNEQWTTDHDDDVVIVMSDEEYQAAAERALDALGMTYAELEEQARSGCFTSAQAHALWVSIGGTIGL